MYNFKDGKKVVHFYGILHTRGLLLTIEVPCGPIIEDESGIDEESKNENLENQVEIQ